MNRKDLMDIMIVISLSILDVLFILRNTLISPGLVYVRDSYPSIIQTKPELVQDGQINLLLIMNNPDLPLLLLQYFLTSEIMDKLYYAYPIFLGFISTYFAVKYLTRNKIISTVTAFLYTISPTFMYFTYWDNYATFVALYPLLLTGLDYVAKKELVKGAILLSLLMSLTTTDPRGLVFTFITTIAFLIYEVFRERKKSIKFLNIFLLSLPIYVALNIRTFYALMVQHVSYVTLGNTISMDQLWLNYYTFSFADNLRGIGLFSPLVNFYQGNYTYSYIFSFFLPIFTILGFLIFDKLWKTVNTFYLTFYLFLVIILSSNIIIFGHNISLNLIYYINNFLKDTPLFPYMWIILPTYLSEMIIAPLFLVFSSVINEIVKSNVTLFSLPSLNTNSLRLFNLSRINFNTLKLLRLLASFLIIVITILAQIVFSYSSFSTGNYQGNYQPLPIAKPIYEVAEFLQNTTGKVAVYAQAIYYDGRYYDAEVLLGLPNVILLPLYQENLSNALQYYGVEYVVTNENVSFFLHQPSLREVYNVSGIYVLKNIYFKPTYTAKGIYLLSTSPSEVPYNIAAVPSYVYVPPEYLAGVIGPNRELLIKADIFYNYSVKIPTHRLPFTINFSSTIALNYYANAIINEFPGISLIQIGSKAEETIGIKPENYAVILSYVEYPDGGTIEITNGSKTLSANTEGSAIQIQTEFLGFISGDKLEIIHPDDRITYMVNLELIPSTLYSQNITLYSHNVNVTVYPVEGQVIPSIGYNIIIGKTEMAESPNLFLPLLINLLSFITIIILYKKYNS